MTTPDDCYTCARTAAGSQAAPFERIAADEHWRLAHAFNSALPGWLVLVPLRHVTSLADLTAAEAGSLGGWQVRASRALVSVTGCQKTYLAQFAEAEGFAHVHFHIVPRPPDLPEELRGPRIFGLLGPADRDLVGADQLTSLSLALSAELRAG